MAVKLEKREKLLLATLQERAQRVKRGKRWQNIKMIVTVIRQYTNVQAYMADWLMISRSFIYPKSGRRQIGEVNQI